MAKSYIKLPNFTAQDIQRFWSKVKRGAPDECWPWQAGGDRYGVFTKDGRCYSSHRVAYYLKYNADPGELDVCHKCDYSLCCNGDHLFLGTTEDNNKDCAEKGRTAKGNRHWSHLYPELVKKGDEHYARRQPEKVARGDKSGRRKHPESYIFETHWTHKHPEYLSRGSAHPSSKLTEADVLLIREEAAKVENVSHSRKGYKKLAERFGVSLQLISRIVKRKTWKHI